MSDPTAPPPAAPFPRRPSKVLVALALFMALAAVALVPYAEQTYWPAYRVLEGPLSALDEFFSTTRQITGITFIGSLIIIVALFDPPRRPALAYLLVALAVTGMVNESAKQILGRARPEFGINMDRDGLKRMEELRAERPGASFEIAREDQWLLFKPGRPYLTSEFASFPSGHSNAAFLIAAFLAALYPKGRILWFVWAFGCAFARVRFRRHFMEDVLMGGAIGTLVACWVFSWHWPVVLGQRVVARLSYKPRAIRP